MYMFKYILKRLGLLVMTFIIIEIVCFVLIKSLPFEISITTPGQDLKILKAQFEARGYYEPIPVQF